MEGAGAPRRRRRRREEEDPSTRLSRTLSYVLRHGAAALGLPMEPDGFVPLAALRRFPPLAALSDAAARRLVAADPKGRFELRAGPLRMRATQGHSLQVPALDLEPLVSPQQLPPTLAHGTRRCRWGPIRAGGLRPMGRLHVHLAPGLPGDPGVRSGIRPDSEIAILIDGPRALAAGIPFFRSTNGVILTPGDASGCLPPRFFLRVLQLRPHRCELPLDGAWCEEEGEEPLHEEEPLHKGEEPLHKGEEPLHKGEEPMEEEGPSHEEEPPWEKEEPPEKEEEPLHKEEEPPWEEGLPWEEGPVHKEGEEPPGEEAPPWWAAPSASQ